MGPLSDALNPERKQRDIDLALKRFVARPLGLREQMKDTGGLISGGFALSFLAGTEWPESDLDICVQRDKGQQLADYLVNVEGYDLASRKIGKYNWSEVEEVHAYDKPTSDPKVNRIIELIFTKAEPFKSVLTECYTTALVNVISHDTAYSLFPIPTFVDKLTFSLKEPDYFHNVLLRKYQIRGYRDIKRLPTSGEHDAAGCCFSQKTRWAGDKFTWKVALPGINASETPSSIEQVKFEIRERQHNQDRLEWMVLKPVD